MLGDTGSPAIKVLTWDHDAENTAGSTPGNVRFERFANDIDEPLTVAYEITGAFAPVGIPTTGTLTFPAGYNSIDVPIIDPNGDGGNINFYLSTNLDEFQNGGTSSLAGEVWMNPAPTGGVSVSLAVSGVTHDVQTSTGVYVPVDNGYDDGGARPPPKPPTEAHTWLRCR